MGRRRALTGTPEGYRRCATCGHAKLRHLFRGTLSCSQQIIGHDTDEQGRTVTITARCSCTGFTDTEEN